MANAKTLEKTAVLRHVAPDSLKSASTATLGGVKGGGGGR